MQIEKCSIKPYAYGAVNHTVIDADKILLVKLDHIGDFITSLPSIRLVRYKYKHAKITLLVGTWNLSLAKRIIDVDNVIAFDYFNRKSELGIMPQNAKDIGYLKANLMSHKFDMAIDLRVHPETRGILLLSGAKYKVGYYTGIPVIDKELSIGIRPANEFTGEYIPHISVQILRLINALGQGSISHVPPSKLLFNQIEINKVNKKYKTLFNKKLLIGINPGVGSLVRQWPNSYYSELINNFVDNSDAHVVIFGSPAETDISDEVYSAVSNKERVTNLSGQLTIGNFALFVKQCHLFIGNNSGSGHIAGLMNTPTIIIFSGQVHESAWHPLGDNTYLITNKTDCTPCFLSYRSQCEHNMDCLTKITPQFVYEKGMEIINERNSKA